MIPDPPADRFCDLVMKGGITSGIVYPPAIAKLAQHYHFKNIGGTSAGAIAAALTAAAEYQRRRTGSMAGFQLVGDLPRTLGTKDTAHNTQLRRLFQPDPEGRRLFQILMGSLNATTTLQRAVALARGCLLQYWPALVFGFTLGSVVGVVDNSPVGGFFVFLFSLVTILALLIYRDMTRHVVRNNYGLCHGMTTQPGNGPALTPWLHQMIQQAAGLPLDEPLTFGKLWAAPGAPQPVGSSAVRSIDLQMFTTNLSHGRPYIFPHIELTARLFFNIEALRPYFPPQVLKCFGEHARPYAPNRDSPQSDPSVDKAMALGLAEIPAAEDFPILIAARMSLSFPLLFSAVPLWAIDYEHERQDRGFQRCLFSDGGISSNFPMHLFDGLVPQWPTFGFDLEPKLAGHRDWTFLPERYLQGIADRWVRFDQHTRPASKMGGFLMSIVGAMQNWNDNTQSRSAGVRDRVVRVRLAKNEGGMNLNMQDTVINQVAQRGGDAADQIISRFLGSPPAGSWNGWSSQRWIRLDAFVYSLDQKIGGLLRALGTNLPHSRTYQELIQAAQRDAPPGHERPLTSGEAQALTSLIDALKQVVQVFGDAAGNYPNEPLPAPELRARSPL